MSSSPTSRPVGPIPAGGALRLGRGGPAGLIGALCGLLALTALSCKDDIAPPTLGTIEVRLNSSSSGGYEEGSIFWGDSLLVPSVDSPVYDFILPAGRQQLRYEKECAEVRPEAEVELVVEAGRITDLDWTVDPAEGGLEVTSTMTGAAIFLDGIDTGKTTPATLECLDSGAHTVSVSLFGATAGPDSIRTVEIGSDFQTIDFPLEPLLQSRGAMNELHTATNCPNCGPADQAAELLWSDPDFLARGYVSVQVHTSWQGSDVFATPSTLARNTFYGDLERQGLPIAVTNGITRRQGFPPDQTPETWSQKYREDAEAFMSDPAPACALYWMEVEREPGVEIRARLRIILLGDILSPDNIELWALDYKDDLVTFVVIHGEDEPFFKVVREYQRAGSMSELGLFHHSDWTDVEFVFDLSGDAEWREDGMGLVAFLQDTSTREIMQVRRQSVP